MNLELTPSDTLTHDQFLYSCRQALQARTTKSGFDSHLRYEPFLFESFRLKDHSVESFRRVVKSIVEHAYAASPQFRREEEISLETISFFSLSIATLVADLETLMRHYGLNELPAIDGVTLPKRENDTLPELEKLFHRFAAYQEAHSHGTDDEESEAFVPFRRSEAELPKDAGLEKDVATEFWGLVYYHIRKTFKNHHKAILEFLNWQFQPEQAPKQIDWRIRPPVGDAFQQFLRSLQSGGRAGAQFNSGSRGERSGNSRHSERPSGPRRDAPTDRPSGSRHDAPADRPRGPRQDASPERTHASRQDTALDRPNGEKNREDRAKRPRSNDSDKRPNRNAESAPPPPEASPEALEAAIEEVERSAKILEKNSRRPGIRLKPQNSFVRRKQHMHAAELGFETESVGEGKDRAVYLKSKAK